MEKLIELLASIIEEDKNNKYNYKYYFYILLFFGITTIIMMFLISFYKDNVLFQKIGEAGFYISSFFLFLIILGKGAKNRENRDVVNKKITKIKEFFEKNKKIIISNRDLKDWGGWLFDYKKDENNIIGFGYSLNNLKLENIWIWVDIKNHKNLYNSLVKKITNSDEKYGKKYSDNFGKNTIIPKDSQNLYEKSEEEIAELIKSYIAIIEKTD